VAPVETPARGCAKDEAGVKSHAHLTYVRTRTRVFRTCEPVPHSASARFLREYEPDSLLIGIALRPHHVLDRVVQHIGALP